MYPERRPYATTVPHSGYRAKPLAPKPPADALAMLRSHVGYDDLRRDAQDDALAAAMTLSSFSPSSVRTPAGRTYPSPITSNYGNTEVAQRLLSSTKRTPQEALAAATLQPPIQCEDRTYHSCQQAVLNTELRDKVEAHNTDWAARLAALYEMLAKIPAESALHSNREAEDMQKYLTTYRCTETMSVTDSALVPEGSLRTPRAEVENMMHLPPVPSDAMRRALDDMLHSPYLLAPLQSYVAKLSVLDKLSGLGWSGEGPAVTATTKEFMQHTSPTSVQLVKGAEARAGTVLSPSRAAVALHERLHYNPGDYSERELKKSEEALLELQQRVQAVKQEKEDAIDANDPITALRSLHAQVDFSNDLLLLYKARMAQIEMHTDDVQDFRRNVVDLIDDAREAAQAVRAYAQTALPSVHHDITATANAIASSEKALADARATEKAVAAQIREQLSAMDGESRTLWQSVLGLLEQIQDKTRERARYVQQCLSRREQRAKATAQAEALLKAQSTHHEQLRQCEEVLARWEEIGSIYSKYVEACVPRLLKHVSSVEDAHEDLAQREAESYVAFYEQFIYVAEEARAKRRTQADRMRLLQRSAQLNHERADDTLDPDATSHAQRLAHATRELDEVQTYLNYIDTMEAERRAEVDPVLQRVLVRHAQAQAGGKGEDDYDSSGNPNNEHSDANGEGEGPAENSVAASQGALQLPENGTVYSADTQVDAQKSTAVKLPAPVGISDSAVVAAAAPNTNNTSTALTAVVDTAAAAATMAHPFVAARCIGLEHEENYLHKQEQLTERELRELEGKLTGLRRSREELRAMEMKYQNANAIRELLGLN